MRIAQLLASTGLICLLALETAVAQPAPPSLSAPSTPARQPSPRGSNRLASVPHMFGDFFGGGGYNLTIQGPPQTITQILNDGVFADYNVFNPATGQPGAGAPDQPIQIFGPGNFLISQSIGPGQDVSGDGIGDTYNITQPVGSTPPGGLPPGKVTFQDAKAVFVNRTGPNMLTTPVNGTSANGWNLLNTYLFEPDGVNLVVPAGGGASVRRVKIAENNSPMPRDRVFFNYNFFNDVTGFDGDINRYTAGGEATIFDGMQSFELRFPFASTLNSDQYVDGTNFTNTEFGNATFTWKAILTEGDSFLVSGGLGVAFPTAETTRVFNGGQEILEIDNHSLHLLPFFALLGSPTDNIFWQAFMQLDSPTNGNPVRGNLAGGNLAPLGQLTDQTILFLDLSAGYILFDDPAASGLTAAAPMMELHYATSTQDADNIVGGGFNLQSPAARFDNLNLTAAVNLVFENRLNLRPGFVVPLRDGLDKDFDFEFMLQANLAL